MPSELKIKQQLLSKELSNPLPDPGTFENIPKVRSLAGDLSDKRVDGKVIIITGANSPLGIGRATAHQFARNGAKALFLCDFSSTHLATHERELTTLYPTVKIHTHQFDAADDAAVKAICDLALKLYSRLDIFFANAGISSRKPFWDITPAEFTDILRVNTLSVFLAAKHASRAMLHTSKEKPHPQGSIVATASVAGLRSGAGPTDYSASKAAVVSLVQTISWQLAGTGIRCNAICPGLIETGMTAPVYDAARKRGTVDRIGQLNPMRRGGVADEVARVVLFLGSDEAGYVNGQAWAVDGGLSAGLPFIMGKLA